MNVIPERINILPKQASSIRNLLRKDDACTSTPYGFRDDCEEKKILSNLVNIQKY